MRAALDASAPPLPTRYGVKGMTNTRTVACPSCGATVHWTQEARYRPFCSERCRLIDLGAWASESYCVPGAEAKDDAGDTPSEAA